MGTVQVIFVVVVLSEAALTGSDVSHVTGSDISHRNRKYVMRIRNRKLRNIRRSRAFDRK